MMARLTEAGIFSEIPIKGGRREPPYVGGWRPVRLRGHPDGLEVMIDARQYHMTHHEDMTAGWSPESVSARMAQKADALRGRSAYKAIRTIRDTRSIRGIGYCSDLTEYIHQASFFIRDLYDMLHESGRMTHVLMPTHMHNTYCRAIDFLYRTAAWREYVKDNASASRLGDIRILPSISANLDSDSTAYAVDASCALCFQGPESCRYRSNMSGCATIETLGRCQFLLLSEDNARTASGMPYRAWPGFRIEVRIK